MNIPLLLSTKGYNKKSLKNDIIAGLVVTAIAVPEVMGIAKLTGVPVQMGLYSIILAPVIFAIFGVSRRLIVGADSATAVLLASGAGAIAAVGSPEYIQIVLALGLMSALLLALITAFKLTFLADLISRPVMVGFMAGVGLQLMITQLPGMLGFSISGIPMEVLSQLPTRLAAINGLSVTIAILVIGIILFFRQSRVPGEIIGLMSAAGLVALFNAGSDGVDMIGALPLGLPSIMLPVVSFHTFLSILPVAFSIALVIVAQSSAVIRSNADEHDERTDVQRDTLALSLAGIASSLTQGLAVNGSPPRTLEADFAGMRSQVASIVMSVCVVLLLLFGGIIFEYLPMAALAAVVFMMGLRLIRLQELGYLARHHGVEFVIAIVALVGVVVFGVFSGIVIAVTVSLMERLSREYHPSDGILLRDGVLSEWAKERVMGLGRVPSDMLVFGFDASLFFENSQYFGHRLRKAVRGAKKTLKSVIIDTSAMDNIDYTAVEQLKQSYRQLSADGIRLGFSHVSPHLMRQFDDYGVIDLVGEHNIFTTLRSAIEYVPAKDQSVAQRVADLGLPEGEYVVVGGAVMEALNLRESTMIDIVVSNDVFTEYMKDPEWRQLASNYGKAVYLKDGICVMRSWLGRTLNTVKRGGVFKKDGVTFMDLPQLIECKQRIGRRKDHSDIGLLRSQIVRNRSRD